MDALVIRNPELLSDALRGLSQSPKRMEPKWFYDAEGSALFERITELPEYYPTRTETAILTAGADRLAAHVPEGRSWSSSAAARASRHGCCSTV